MEIAGAAHSHTGAASEPFASDTEKWGKVIERAGLKPE